MNTSLVIINFRNKSSLTYFVGRLLSSGSKFKGFWITELLSCSDIFLNGNYFSNFRGSKFRTCPRFAESSVVLRERGINYTVR
jgi:hypothetical protein